MTVRRSRRLRHRQSDNDETSLDSTPSSHIKSTKQHEKNSKLSSASTPASQRKPLAQLDPQSLKQFSNKSIKESKHKNIPSNTKGTHKSNPKSSTLPTSSIPKSTQHHVKENTTFTASKSKQLDMISPQSTQKNINTPSQQRTPSQSVPFASPPISSPARRVETPPGSSAYHATLSHARFQISPNPHQRQQSQSLLRTNETQPGSSSDHAKLTSNSTIIPLSQHRNQFQTLPPTSRREEVPPGTSSQHANLNLNQHQKLSSPSQVDKITPVHIIPRKETPPGSSTYHAALRETQTQTQPNRQRKRNERLSDEFTTPTPVKRPLRIRRTTTEQRTPITPSSPLNLDIEEENENQQEITPNTQVEIDYVPRIGRPRLSQTPTLVRGPRVVATYSRKRRLQQTGDVEVQLPSMTALGLQPDTPTSGSEKSASSEWEASSDEEEDLESSEERPRKTQKKKDPQLVAFIKQQKGFWNEVDNIDLEEEFEF